MEKQSEPAQNNDCVESAMRKGDNVCHINAKTVPSGGYHTPTQAAKELEDLLEHGPKGCGSTRAQWKLEAHRAQQWGEQPTRTFDDLMLSYLRAEQDKRSHR